MTILQRFISKLHLSETKEMIVQNVIWVVMGKIINLASGLFVGILVARYLGPEQYGLMSYVISYVILFQTLSIFGLDSIEIREEARGQTPYQTIIGTAFGLKVIFGLVFMALVILTSWQMDADAFTTLLVAVYSLTIILNSFSVIRNYFIAIVQNEYVVKVEMSSTVVGIGIKILLLLLNAPLLFFLMAFTLDGFLISSGYWIVYHSKIGRVRDWKFDMSYARFLLKESFPLLLTNVAVIIYQRIDQVMIGQMIDKESVGYFSVASRFTEILIYIPMMLAQTITPILVRIRERCEQEYIQKSQKFMNLSIWLSLLVAAIVSILSYWIILYTFGKAYLPAVAVLQVMAFKAAGVALSNTAGAMLVTEGLQRYAIFRDGLGCVVCVVFNYLLLPRYGIIAAAFVSIISNVAAGYLADAMIPTYRHLFLRQTKALTIGWKDVIAAIPFVKEHKC